MHYGSFHMTLKKLDDTEVINKGQVTALITLTNKVNELVDTINLMKDNSNTVKKPATRSKAK